MQDLGYELPRILIPRTRVNKGRKRRERAEPAREPDPLRCGRYPIVGRTCENLWPGGADGWPPSPPRVAVVRVVKYKMSSVAIAVPPLCLTAFMSRCPLSS